MYYAAKFFFFGFFKKKEKQNKTIDLTSWYKFISLNDSWIGTSISVNHINDVAAALVYTDEKTRNRFIERSKGLARWTPQTAELEKLIEKNKTISKLKSDEAKLIVVECLKSRKHLLAVDYPY